MQQTGASNSPLPQKKSVFSLTGHKRDKTIKDDHVRVKHFNEKASMKGILPPGSMNDVSTPEIETEAYFGYPMTLDYVVDLYIESTDSTVDSYTTIADTGSSNLAVAVSSCSNCASGSTDLSVDYYSPEMCVQVTYGSGSWSGLMADSTFVGMGSDSDYSGTDVYFAAITDGSDFFTSDGFQGILGLGYSGISNQYMECSSSSQQSIDATPFTDSLASASIIDENIFTMSFCGAVTEMAIGGIDSSQYTGDITYVDTQKTYGEYYGYYLVNIDAISIDGEDIGDVSSMNTIGGTLVDSGTTLLYLSTSVYSTVKTAVESSLSSLSSSFFEWESCITESDTSSLPTLTFTIDSYDLELEPVDYLLYYGNCYYWGISSSSVPIIGNIALQDLIVVFDKDSNKVGFGDAVCISTEEDEDPNRPKNHPSHGGLTFEQIFSTQSTLKSPVLYTVFGFGLFAAIIAVVSFYRSHIRLNYSKIPTSADQ